MAEKPGTASKARIAALPPDPALAPVAPDYIRLAVWERGGPLKRAFGLSWSVFPATTAINDDIVADVADRAGVNLGYFFFAQPFSAKSASINDCPSENRCCNYVRNAVAHHGNHHLSPAHRHAGKTAKIMPNWEIGPDVQFPS